MKVLTASALVLSLALTATAQFRSGVDLVSFVVVASDKEGLVDGLTKDDFTVLEEGRPQTIQFFAQGDVSERMPLRLGLLFDVSGSMGMDIERSRSAAIRFMNALEHAKDVTLVEFDTEVRLARYGQDDFPRLIERIRARKPDGWTALYDAIGVYLNGMAMEEGQKVLVLYSDGGDTRSRMSISQVIDLLKWIDVTVYAIGFVEHQGSRRFEQRMRLEQLARATGGQAFFPGSRNQLDEMYEKILGELAARYTLGYISNSGARPGFRKVEIKVTNPAYRNIKIRARDGYYAAGNASSSSR
ncbi:MAG TPA: VWA domain-containing protein [Vicinamibacterales bacterium]|nr:VWA domain-containing protein [Vicinamibacterales bacterium]